MTNANELSILQSWQFNASPWIKAIEESQIESRRLVTNQAIIETILSLGVKNLLDIGCGEGWLTRALIKEGLSATGIDATLALIEKAKAMGIGRFKVLSYEAVSSQTIDKDYDAVVCNFSLLGRESVEQLLQALGSILAKKSYLIIQTLHPVSCNNGQAYVDGWREGSWEGFDSAFKQPAPWYFRTISSWLSLLRQCGFQLIQVNEPINSNNGQACSLIMVGQL